MTKAAQGRQPALVPCLRARRNSTTAPTHTVATIAFAVGRVEPARQASTAAVTRLRRSSAYSAQADRQIARVSAYRAPWITAEGSSDQSTAKIRPVRASRTRAPISDSAQAQARAAIQVTARPTAVTLRPVTMWPSPIRPG